MDNLLTLLGEARAIMRVGMSTHRPSPETAERYLVHYHLYLRGEAGALSTGDAMLVWRASALRYGALCQLANDIPVYEAALERGDHETATALADQLRAAVDLLYRHPPAWSGRRARGDGESVQRVDVEELASLYDDAKKRASQRGRHSRRPPTIKAIQDLLQEACRMVAEVSIDKPEAA
ncbi:hypothetical protein [Azospirillum melinis]